MRSKMRNGVWLENADEVHAALDELNRRIKYASAAKIQELALDIMAQSVDLTPLDTGALRASAYVDSPTYSGNEVNVELGYAKDSSDPVREYAGVQHEVDWYEHPIGQDHFLLAAVGIVAGNYNKNASRFAEAVTQAAEYVASRFRG